MSSELVGQILLNQYRVDEHIRSTPFGDLYRATDTRNNKYLGLTQLPKSASNNSEVIKELENIAGQLRNMTIPNVAAYHGVFQTPQHAFLLEDWIDGPTLRDVLNKNPVTVQEALIFTKALCNILESLHKRNFLYLNLIPEFVHVNQQGEIFLSGLMGCGLNGEKNFTTLNKFSHLHLAPEQFTGQALSPASDIYSLAILIYQLTTGAWINGKAAPKTSEAIRKAQLENIPPAPISLNPSIPDNFSRMTLWALRKKPEDRLKTTTELLSSLTLAAQTSVDAIPPQITPQAGPVTWALLNEWQFLPTLKPNLIAQDLPPLHDRLANLDEPKSKKQISRNRFVPIFLFLLIAGFASLFWFVKPAPVIVPTPIQVTPFVADFTAEPSITPSPRPTLENGGRIAYTCTRGDYNQICMVNRDGTNPIQLTDMDASNYYPIFTPDGASLLFASNRNGAFDLYLLQFSAKQLIQLTQNVGNVISPDYSPDGRQIVFANKVGEEKTAIWMVNADGLNPRLVYAGVDEIVAVAWSPNGEKIAYAMSIGVPQEYEIFIMDTNGKNHARVSEGLQGIGGSIDWAPDGRNLLIYAGPYNDKDIFKLDINTLAVTQLTDGGNNAGGAYSPDGKYIVFNSLRNDDQADLYIMRADGTNQVQLTNNPEPDWGASWIE
ncbi:MAG: serine/threonine-protein kinase [Anaerolineales bacterium]|nr:serine/threonine-protein kinase [Anaerolineales bacterium]